MKDIKLVALDLDGTLFDNSSHISERNLTAIRSITDKGIHVVISTGRPFEGIPFDQIKGTGFHPWKDIGHRFHEKPSLHMHDSFLAKIQDGHLLKVHMP